MSGDARKMPPLRPSAVAVHDDGDVARQPIRVENSEQAFFLAANWFERIRYFHAIDFLQIPDGDDAGECMCRHLKANIRHQTVQHDRSDFNGNVCKQSTRTLLIQQAVMRGGLCYAAGREVRLWQCEIQAQALQ
jgi:hypothetical protein